MATKERLIEKFKESLFNGNPVERESSRLLSVTTDKGNKITITNRYSTRGDISYFIKYENTNEIYSIDKECYENFFKTFDEIDNNI